MTALPEPPHLHAVTWPTGRSLDGDGLALAYAALERVRAEHQLRRLSVVVDDPVLGRQVVVVPRGELPSIIEGGTGWSSEPPLEEPSTDIELAVALCRTVLRVEVPTTPVDAVELSLRRLEGVGAVGFDVDRDVIRVQVDGASTDAVADAALRIVRAELDRIVVVEVRQAGNTPPSAPAAPVAPDTAGWSALDVVAIRTAPESGELEVHLRAGDVRTVGRAPLTRGLVGAADAALEAWHALPDASPRRVAWARTVDTAADSRFVVAVALEVPEARTVTHGIGAALSAVDAAVHATVDALGH